MLSTEPWAQGSLFKWIIDSTWLLKNVSKSDGSTSPKLSPENHVGRSFDDVLPLHAWISLMDIFVIIGGHSGRKCPACAAQGRCSTFADGKQTYGRHVYKK